MKQLLKAKELHQEIITLDEEIMFLEKSIDNVINNDLEVQNNFTIIEKKTEKLELDEDGSIKKSNSESLMDYIYASHRYESTTENSFDFDKKISPSEFIIMYGGLLNYKNNLRKKVINEFNELHLKLKI